MTASDPVIPKTQSARHPVRSNLSAPNRPDRPACLFRREKAQRALSSRIFSALARSAPGCCPISRERRGFPPVHAAAAKVWAKSPLIIFSSHAWARLPGSPGQGCIHRHRDVIRRDLGPGHRVSHTGCDFACPMTPKNPSIIAGQKIPQTPSKSAFPISLSATAYPPGRLW
jgi:hypothetical protein